MFACAAWAGGEQAERRGGKSGLVSLASLVVSSDQTIIKLWPTRARLPERSRDKKIQIFPVQPAPSQHRQPQTDNLGPAPWSSRNGPRLGPYLAQNSSGHVLERKQRQPKRLYNGWERSIDVWQGCKAWPERHLLQQAREMSSTSQKRPNM